MPGVKPIAPPDAVHVGVEHFGRGVERPLQRAGAAVARAECIDVLGVVVVDGDWRTGHTLYLRCLPGSREAAIRDPSPRSRPLQNGSRLSRYALGRDDSGARQATAANRSSHW